MPPLNILAVGKVKDKASRELEEKYQERLSHYVRISIRCVKDSPAADPGQRRKEEAQSLLSAVADSDYLVVLDREGETVTSEGLARELQALTNRSVRNIVFVIGGAYGLDDPVRQRANRILSLSALTFPHELARVILLEQLYRAYTILRGEKYHH
ncbi:MAG: 23S rRNA (pseudouridine(1915)-N(3))-methyltransferase RlmH [Deltaproteobacteria bacterium]|nr:23S rRNA (pseudouridine(1915)-N(3))-methyltransferase RlmH [Deltaproteobacteria bacterium]